MWISPHHPQFQKVILYQELITLQHQIWIWNIYFWIRFFFEYQESFKTNVSNRFWVQNHLLNLWSLVVNSLRLFCIVKKQVLNIHIKAFMWFFNITSKLFEWILNPFEIYYTFYYNCMITVFFLSIFAKLLIIQPKCHWINK